MAQSLQKLRRNMQETFKEATPAQKALAITGAVLGAPVAVVGAVGMLVVGVASLLPFGIVYGYSKLFTVLEPPSSLSGPSHLVSARPKVRQAAMEKARELGIEFNCFNFAIIGICGSGKSSLANGLRFVDPFDDTAARAPVSVGVAGNQTAGKYPDPENPYLVYWDQPGYDDTNHPVETYFEDKALLAYDCILVVTDSRFRASDVHLTLQAIEHKIPVILVRTKFDNDIANEHHIQTKKKLKGLPSKDLVDDLKKKVASSIRLDLVKGGIPYQQQLPLFFVHANAFLDARKLEEYFQEISYATADKDKPDRPPVLVTPPDIEECVVDEIALVMHLLQTARDMRVLSELDAEDA